MTDMEIVLASRNKKKIGEMKTLLSKFCAGEVKVLSLDDIGFFGDIEEELVAPDALIREFIGGGIYEY